MNSRNLGRQKSLYFDTWPEVGLAAARHLRDVTGHEIASGNDPSHENGRQARRDYRKPEPVRHRSGRMAWKRMEREGRGRHSP